MKSGKRHSGFTLIELMIAVAIVAILAMIAYPSYQQYFIRANRSAAQQFLMDLAQREEQFLLDNRSYTDVVGAGGLNATVPAEVATHYGNPAIAVGATPPSWTISVAPTSGMMANDGTLFINNLSQRWRDINGNGQPDSDEGWE